MSDLVNIKDERFWQILFDEACVEGQQAERIEKELKKITVEPVRGEWAHIGGDEWCCSNCGHVISTEGSWEKPEKKFCEECGADMRKKVE